MDKTLEKILGRWLKQQKSACGIYLNLSVLFGVLTGLALVLQAYLLASMLQGMIIDSLPKTQFMTEFYLLAGLIVLRALLAYGRERISFKAGCLLRGAIRKAVLDKLTELGPVYIKGKPAGSWASIVLEQVEDLQDFYAKYLPQMMLAGFIPLTILAVVFPINWAAGIILLATAPLIPLFMILVGMGAADANRKNFSALARLSGHFMDRLKGLETIKLFYRGDSEVKAIETASEELRSRTMSVLRMAFLSSAVLEFFAAVSIAVLAVYFGFSFLDHLDFGHYGVGLTLFTGLFVLILAPEFYQPLRDLGTHYHAKAQAVGAAEALMELLQHQNQAQTQNQNQNQSQNQNQADSTEHGAKPLMSLAPLTVKLRDVRVCSLQGQPLIGPINLDIEAGEQLAVVGPSGAGKTTLLNMLLGFLPYEGSVLINDIELSQLDKVSYRRQLAWLGQEPQLFHGSIFDNVAMSNPDMSEAEVYALLDKANIGDFVRQQALGLVHPIDEQSAGVSVGQAQRLCLARALGQDAKLFLLDEPTASLDSISEQSVLTALQQATAKASCLMVTHRLDALKQASKIVVLDNGAIVQQGSYQALFNQPGLFRDMCHELPVGGSLDEGGQ
ncbi:cysteine/glutathione ABC transporter permease/ATP-binding protein CydD [Shewanella sp. Isolate11]|uniref:heme ABC transporter permease/ATP-binding protein CydD n=1 Tax=Shewanella sp. Isolate11 TaxID=2908530 RepID=UPI001EFCE850|nr:cysteine/glutathione ABC transporter permease/ATP-binding protein CydD [Shewanella sp. Isolate11]MCG9697546.1 cysteine/glutathione ABC transporter permease/ATP-binding protein CydD [Shewanella sp. Isolate11]